MPTLLADYDVAILGDVPSSPAQAAMLPTWVDGGGNLIAMRPDPDLAGAARPDRCGHRPL